MFLNQLENDNKELFLKVCVLAALSNGLFANEEKEMISAYCREMNIPENIPECSESIEDIAAVLAEKASDVEKNIIVLEVLGLVKSDGLYEDKEKAFMETLVSGMRTKEGMLSKMESLLEIYTVVCKELYAAVLD